MADFPMSGPDPAPVEEPGEGAPPPEGPDDGTHEADDDEGEHNDEGEAA